MKKDMSVETKILCREFAVFALACLAFVPNARAVSPPPDGGYSGGNTAEGQNALFSLSSGIYNTAVGFLSLRSDTTGNFNTAAGAGTLLLNTADENTATGTAALLSNTTGPANMANGAFALFDNTTGGFNPATGDAALFSNTIGGQNTATGFNALTSNTIGNRNSASGVAALSNNTTGNDNTAIGEEALNRNTVGSGNIAVGNLAGSQQDADAGNNIYIGDHGASGDINTIAIGIEGTHTDHTFIQGIFGATAFDGMAVFARSSGRLGTITSSARFKQNIRDMADASNALLRLRPVTFRYKPNFDPNGTPQFGLVAEEVAEVNSGLVVRDANGQPYGVRYEQINAMLLNEFLKEHRKVEQQNQKLEDQDQRIQEQKTAIAQLKSAMQSQAATTAQQHEQIQALSVGLQKVSGQIGASRPAPQTIFSSN